MQNAVAVEANSEILTERRYTSAKRQTLAKLDDQKNNYKEL